MMFVDKFGQPPKPPPTLDEMLVSLRQGAASAREASQHFRQVASAIDRIQVAASAWRRALEAKS